MSLFSHNYYLRLFHKNMTKELYTNPLLCKTLSSKFILIKFTSSYCSLASEFVQHSMYVTIPHFHLLIFNQVVAVIFFLIKAGEGQLPYYPFIWYVVMEDASRPVSFFSPWYFDGLFLKNCMKHNGIAANLLESCGVCSNICFQEKSYFYYNMTYVICTHICIYIIKLFSVLYFLIK